VVHLLVTRLFALDAHAREIAATIDDCLGRVVPR
jgi:hypothetical protein